MLKILAGRNNLLPSALVASIRECNDDLDQLVIVPRQLTLETERMLLDKLHLPGSFQLQVLSTERLCTRIFDAAGQPDGVRLDDRGRILLVREAIRLSQKDLALYGGTAQGRGFTERCADQLERFRQGGVSPEQLSAFADSQAGTAGMKFRDLSCILKHYEALLAGRFQDGEVEFTEAVRRTNKADFLKNSRVWFYGYDMVPPTLHQLMVAVAEAAVEVSVLMPMPADPNVSDADAFKPLRRAAGRLTDLAHREGVEIKWIPIERGPNIEAPQQSPALRALEDGLFAYPPRRPECPPNGIQMAQLNDPLEECRYAAATARHLAYQNGWHWGDMLLLCDDLDNYTSPLQAAFDAYGIPLFLASSRPAARHRLSEFLLTALKAVDKGFPQEDMLALFSFDLLPVSKDEAERFINFSISKGLKYTRFFKPLTDLPDMEPIRVCLTRPIEALRDSLRDSKTLEDQLRALYAFLANSGAQEKAERRVTELSKQGRWEMAGEEAQVINRILGAMDQMQGLLGQEKRKLSELYDLLSESLSVSIIKGLPQSSDAVFAQSVDGACMRHVKAIMVLGLNDRSSAAGDGLLTGAQQRALVDFTKAYLGPDDADLARIRRFKVKNALGMATEFVLISNAQSGIDGGALRPSILFQMLRAQFPALRPAGGVQRDQNIDRLLGMSPKANLNAIAQRISEGTQALTEQDKASLYALNRLSKEDASAAQGIRLIYAAMDRAAAMEALSPSTARQLYSRLRLQSISSLEKFAKCPFSYYVSYGLKPDLVEPYEFNTANEGTFFHAAVERFLNEAGNSIDDMSVEEAERRMEKIADEELSKLMDGPLGDSAFTRAESRQLKATAVNSAAALAGRMQFTDYRPAAMELGFGGQFDDVGALELPGGGQLRGVIDRVDLKHTENGDLLQIIDYKRDGKKFEPYQAYYGLRLQLLCYLIVAEEYFGALPAGVFYFPIKSGIVNSQSLDPGDIEGIRADEMGMKGIGYEDAESYEEYGAEPIGLLMRLVLRRAGEHEQAIRSGQCAIAPAKAGTTYLPCEYCDYRAACLFEDKLDAHRVRIFKKIDVADVYMRSRAEET